MSKPDIDFEKLLQQQLAAPFVPEIDDDYDISYFDEPDMATGYDSKDLDDVVVNPDDFAGF